MKIRPLGPELFHADGRADGQTERLTHELKRKLTDAIRNSADAPKKPIELLRYIDCT